MVRGARRHVTPYPKMDAILESFKYTTVFPESRDFGLISMIVRIRFFSKFTLSRDVETNSGPYTIIDLNKTISAPYSQGNIALFGPNAGFQCLTMSLCALIYEHQNSISSSADLASIMNTGNELYSVQSRLYNQEFLLFTELPQMVTVLETNYQMEYSPSYTGNIHDVLSNVGFTLLHAFR